MTLRLRIALTTAVLAGAAAAAVATAGYRVAGSRLDAEIDGSLSTARDAVARTDSDARRTCSGESGTDPSPGGGRGRGSRGARVPRDVIVQCIDANGSVLYASSSTLIPVTTDDVAVADGTGPSERRSRRDIDDDDHRVLTVRAQTVGAVQIARSLEEKGRVLASLLRRTLLLAGLAIVAAAAAGAWLAGRIARPLTRLAAAADEIAETGRLDVDLAVPAARRPGRGADETARLSHAFTTMLDSLRTSRAAQARLVQDAGHELRTPLTSLRTNIALLRRPDLPAVKREGILADLDAELRELTGITNELVALAADGAADEPPAPVDLATLVVESAQRWRRRSDREIVVRLDPAVQAGAPVTVSLPPTGAQRIVDNLLSNATKFTSSGAVEVDLRADDGTAVLSVRDHGPGIDPVDLPHVFDRFYRSDAARALSGSGLGLSIVRDVVRRHGGSVTAANDPGGGARFTVTVPLLRSVP